MKKTIELPKKPKAKSCEQGKDKLIGQRNCCAI